MHAFADTGLHTTVADCFGGGIVQVLSVALLLFPQCLNGHSLIAAKGVLNLNEGHANSWKSCVPHCVTRDEGWEALWWRASNSYTMPRRGEHARQLTAEILHDFIYQVPRNLEVTSILDHAVFMSSTVAQRVFFPWSERSWCEKNPLPQQRPQHIV